jgi:AraC family transcriptional regulator
VTERDREGDERIARDPNGFVARFRRVLAHVDAHLDEKLDVDRLAGVAAYSKFHFLRQFAALFGVGAHEFVQLTRLRRAAHELAYRERQVIDLAFDAGYESPEAFARAFKKAVGQTPTEFRKQPDWAACDAATRPMREVRRQHMKPETERRVDIVTFAETKVGVLEHRGDPRLIGDTIRKFIEWRRANHLPPSTSATFNLLYGDPDTTPPDEFRLDLCAAVKGEVAPNEQGVAGRTIPGGRCARLRHVGTDDGFGATFDYLYKEWLPASGEEPRDFPLFLQRVKMYPDVPEREAVTDVFLPLK